MKPVKIAFAGTGGYADYCLGLLLDHVPPEEYELAGAADPFAAAAPRAGLLRERGVPLYDTVEELLAARQADALYIASPITFHRRQCEAALRHGCAVLCEKPLTASYADALRLRDMAREGGKPFGVGFQWSFAPPMLAAKRDILAGRYGKPLLCRALVSWQRFDGYYLGSTWKGRVTDAQGSLVRDSIVTNATAHYLHNLFFMMGEVLDRSAMPAQMQGALLRAKPIESFDTCFLKGRFASGARLLFLSTHSGDASVEPVVEYTFEKGVLRIDANEAIPAVRGRLEGGEEILYGSVSTRESDSFKVKALLAAAREGAPMACPIDAVLPHQAVCDALFSQLPIQAFPEERLYRTADPAGWFVRGLCEELERCFAAGETPAGAGLAWAGSDGALDLSAYR